MVNCFLPCSDEKAFDDSEYDGGKKRILETEFSLIFKTVATKFLTNKELVGQAPPYISGYQGIRESGSRTSGKQGIR